MVNANLRAKNGLGLGARLVRTHSCSLWPLRDLSWRMATLSGIQCCDSRLVSSARAINHYKNHPEVEGGGAGGLAPSRGGAAWGGQDRVHHHLYDVMQRCSDLLLFSVGEGCLPRVCAFNASRRVSSAKTRNEFLTVLY